jgi:uroporphyrinogen decarboxylase
MRSETPEIAIELSLQVRRRQRTPDLDTPLTLAPRVQPWRAFKPDGVIMFSDILTPLPALGCVFDFRPTQRGALPSLTRCCLPVA